MAQSTVAKVDELEKLYRLHDANKVRAYLDAHPKMVDLLLEARSHIESQFGQGVVVKLRFPRVHRGTWLVTFQWGEYFFLAKDLS